MACLGGEWGRRVNNIAADAGWVMIGFSGEDVVVGCVDFKFVQCGTEFDFMLSWVAVLFFFFLDRLLWC